VETDLEVLLHATWGLLVFAVVALAIEGFHWIRQEKRQLSEYEKELARARNEQESRKTEEQTGAKRDGQRRAHEEKGRARRDQGQRESERKAEQQRQRETEEAQARARREEERRRAGQEEREREWRRQQWENEDNGKKELDFGRVLGLKGNVKKEEIKQRYRELCVQYHPDKVATLGPRLQEVAEEEMKKINEAYEFFRRKYDL